MALRLESELETNQSVLRFKEQSFLTLGIGRGASWRWRRCRRGATVREPLRRWYASRFAQQDIDLKLYLSTLRCDFRKASAEQTNGIKTNENRVERRTSVMFGLIYQKGSDPSSSCQSPSDKPP